MLDFIRNMDFEVSQTRTLHFTGGITGFRILTENISSLPILLRATDPTADFGGGTLVAYDINFTSKNLSITNKTIESKAVISDFSVSSLSENISYTFTPNWQAIEFVIEGNTTNPELKIDINLVQSILYIQSF